MSDKPFKLAVNTGGGDAPGLNAVIRSVTLAAIRRGWEVHGIKFGYRGLLDRKSIVPLTADSVRHITNVGGTILGTVNKADPWLKKLEEYPATPTTDAGADAVVENFKELGFDALIAIGGDGSMTIAQKLYERGVPLVGVPKTIDNDLAATDYTFGFDTAVSNATDAIDKLHSTAESHERTLIVELMGRDAGWITLHAGVASDADVVLIPERPFHYSKVFEKIRHCYQSGKRYAIVAVAEGAKAAGGHTVILRAAEEGRARRLGGIGSQIAEEIATHCDVETRVLVLGHLQRGGGPTAFDRVLALQLGAAAVDCVAMEQFGHMVALKTPHVEAVPIKEAIKHIRRVPQDCALVDTARDLGICLG